MIILFIILFLLMLPGLRFSSFNQDYVSIESTNAIKGVFAIVILFSHMSGYIILNDNIFDNAFACILRHLGQLMVAPYLFFSGFGILESIKRKEDYAKTFPRKRILKTLLNFDLAVFIYLLVNIISGPRYPLANYLTCWVGWESIGNSNWFIFVILLLYLSAYLSIVVAKHFGNRDAHRIMVIIVTSVMSIISWIIFRLSGKGNWWYDTILTFPLGMWFSYYKNHFNCLMRRRMMSWVILSFAVISLAIWHFTIGNDRIGVCACLFCVALISIMTKVHLGNGVLKWLGTHAFAIYIMQRLPMNIYALLGWNEAPILFAMLSIPSAIIIAWAYNKALLAIDTKLKF